MPNGVPEMSAYEVLETHGFLDEFTETDGQGDPVFGGWEDSECSTCGVTIYPSGRMRHIEWHRQMRVSLWILTKWVGDTVDVLDSLKKLAIGQGEINSLITSTIGKESA
jgi:hypothetical protein